MKTSFSQNWTRRRLLQTTALSAGLASPLSSTQALQPVPRKRVVFVYTPMGAPPEHWKPQVCGDSFTLGPASAPLEPVKHHCLFLNNLLVTDAGPGIPEKTLGGGFTGSRVTTLDIRLGEALAAGVQMPNLHMGTHTFEGVVSKKDLAQVMFFRHAALVYGGLSEQSDFVLDTPLDRKFREELMSSPVTTPFDREVDLQIELSALALSRNITNVVTLMWGDTQGTIRLPDYYTDVSGMEFHHAAHTAPEIYTLFRAYLSAKLAYLIQLLEVVRDDNNQSLLETTLIVHVTDDGDGRDHIGTNAPYLIAGGKNIFRNGAVLDAKNATQHDLMDSLADAYGLEDVKYGSQIIDGLKKV